MPAAFFFPFPNAALTSTIPFQGTTIAKLNCLVTSCPTSDSFRQDQSQGPGRLPPLSFSRLHCGNNIPFLAHKCLFIPALSKPSFPQTTKKLMCTCPPPCTHVKTIKAYKPWPFSIPFCLTYACSPFPETPIIRVAEAELLGIGDRPGPCPPPASLRSLPSCSSFPAASSR